MTALGQLQVTTVYVLGGTDAISADEFTQLENMTSSAPGGDKLQVIRVAGTDRFATAEAINTTPPASNVGEVNGLKTALVANGYTFPDALAGGAVAAGAALPTITTDPDSLSTAAAQTLTALGIKQVYILGGTDAVTQAVQNQISGMGITTNRLAGPTRTATALAIANFAAQNLGFTAAGGCTTDPVTGQKGCAFSAIDVARGDDAGGGIDALALAPLAGKTRTPILLTGDVDDPSPDTYGEIGLSAQIGTLKAVNIIGGPVAISPGDQTFLTVAAGGGEHPTYTTSATTAAAGASVTAQSGLNICPGSSVGNQGYLTTALIPVNNGTVTGVETTFPPTTTQLAGGAWTDVVTIPSTATAGTTYQLVIACAVSFTGDPTIYGIEGYAPAVITVG
jgi:putative cell wall-binding protein